jgi:hypothetical protein
MSAAPVTVESHTDLFLQACLRALIRAEVDGRVPARFTGTGPDIWNTFRNELTATDLAALCIEDAGVSMPVPFAPEQWRPEPALSHAEGWPEWGLQRPLASEVRAWNHAALASAQQPRDVYLQAQAGLVGIEVPSDDVLTPLRLPDRHYDR